jgi:hypothetical protein
VVGHHWERQIIKKGRLILSFFLDYIDWRSIMERKHNAGKGDKYRPVDQSKWKENWEKAFPKKKKKTKVTKTKKENSK